jgi:hypothetical protein
MMEGRENMAAADDRAGLRCRFVNAETPEPGVALS